MECFPDKSAQDLFSIQFDTELAYGNLSSPANVDLYRTQLRNVFTEHKLLAQLCVERMGDQLNYVGTATVARDLEYLSATLEGRDTPVYA